MKPKILIFCLLFFIVLANPLFGQEKEKDIYVKAQNSNWNNFSKSVELENNIRFFYNRDSIPNIEILVADDSVRLDQLLKDSFSSIGIKVSKDERGNYFLFKDFSVNTNLDNLFLEIQQNKTAHEGIEYKEADSEYITTYQDLISESLVIGSTKNGNGNGNKTVTLSGYITNASDGSTIPQARLKINETNQNVVTNTSGYYEVLLKPGTYTLTANSLGMYEKNYKLTIISTGQLTIPLKTKSFLIDEAVVSANRNHNVRGTTMGFEKITAKSIKELPVILGEADIVKVALLLPGVQTVGEVSSGFNVRGSPTDQNMFYINDLPIYNSSHLFGLYTTFNSDAISEFEFYKSNIPIEYGGHLSSIFDIKAKKGNTENFSARGGIGPLSSRILVEGPVRKNSSSSYLISYRSTYSDWLLKQIDNVDIKNSSASFYDALMYFTFRLTKKDNIDLFLYGSNDDANLAFGIKNKYTNLGGSLKWTHAFNKKLISEFDIVKSQYYYYTENYEIVYLGYKNSFELNHNEAKLKFKYFLNNRQEFQFGLNAKLYDLNYGDFLPLNEESTIKPIEFEPEKAITGSIFLSDKWDISNRLSFEAGIRATYYSYLGPKTIYSYLENSPKEINNIIDTTRYGKNENISDNINFDFRISGKYEITPDFSVKASYNTLHQYIFMLSNTVSVTPTSKWKLSDPHLEPMKGEQYSLGFYKNLWNDKIETSVELYYKEVENQVEYKDGANFLTDPVPEISVIQGDIQAYGIEIMVKKKMGKLNGWINYTYSNAEVTAFNSNTGEMNNNGNPYPANYDRPHAANLALNYKATKRISISMNVVYSTGRPVTYPTSIYYQNGIQITGFSGRNEYRLPDYFRTDLSINIEGNLKKSKFAHSSWSIGFYNLTARKNPYSIVFQNEDGVIKGYEISILGTIIPSINYNLKFGNYED
ncbi:MAG: carboxypeptidase-like regulatory domain-containing protein [Bacteroidales bacterium]|nr:carboxypeptidase-like regulatory domain-containing protein [Bacteroidales bacterium]